MPALRAGTEVGGANADGADSQYCVVAGTASSAVVGQDGTENAGVVAPNCGGIIVDSPARNRDDGGVTRIR